MYVDATLHLDEGRFWTQTLATTKDNVVYVNKIENIILKLILKKKSNVINPYALV